MTPDGPSKAKALLSQFPGPVVVRPRRFYLAACLVASLCFVLIGAFLLATEGSSAMAWGSTAFFAVCGLVLGFCLLPGSLSLTLDRAGFRFTIFYRTRRAEWQNVSDIYAASAPWPARQQYVRYRDAGLNGSKLSRWESEELGFNASLPGYFELQADELAELMRRWRLMALDSNAGREDRRDDVDQIPLYSPR